MDEKRILRELEKIKNRLDVLASKIEDVHTWSTPHLQIPEDTIIIRTDNDV